jgi:hypothetical protein
MEDMKMMLFQMERSLSFEECHASKKIFEVRKSIGEELTLKLVVFVIAAFQNTLKIANGLTASEIVMVADDFINVYTHDSINDLIYALRKARMEGKEFYNKFSQQDLQAILKVYFEQKSIWIENEERVKPFAVPSAVNAQIQIMLSTPAEPEESITLRMKREKAIKMSQKPLKPNLSEAEYSALANIGEAYKETNGE